MHKIEKSNLDEQHINEINNLNNEISKIQINHDDIKNKLIIKHTNELYDLENIKNEEIQNYKNILNEKSQLHNDEILELKKHNKEIDDFKKLNEIKNKKILECRQYAIITVNNI